MTKYDGRNQRSLTISETKQIGGRAGRFGSEFSEGEVTTYFILLTYRFDRADIKQLHSLMRKESLNVKVFNLLLTFRWLD